MTVVDEKTEDRRGTEERGRAPDAARTSFGSRPSSSPHRRSAKGRLRAWFVRTGWVHLVLMLGVWMFLFPFFWMLATSVKTDEELTESTVLPGVVLFRPTSPYVREASAPEKPTDVTAGQWAAALPKLTELASGAIAKYQGDRPAQASVAPFDVAGHRAAAARLLIGSTVGRLNRRLWSGDEAALVSEFRVLLTDSAIASALSGSLARVELFSFQLRTLNLHIYNLTEGKDFASKWRVESGPAELFQSGKTTLLSYHFESPSSEPVVLRYDVRLPPGVSRSDIYKLILSASADNSWHRVNFAIDVDGDRWQSDESVYLAQHRTQGFIYQPPTFDDDLMRAKTWVSIRKVGVAAPASAVPAGEGLPATVRVTLTPSSTIVANWGKVVRNYDRAFKSVPFWRYIGNSVVLVVLCTVGSLFSASFVAYSFARLNWPGRSIAFMVLLGTIMLPHQVTMIPGFMIWRTLHWYNTLNPLWVPAFFGSAFFIFLMVQHMKTIPRELEEAARLDGLNAVQSWYYIILPNVKPTLAAISILSFMGAWNEFMGPLIYLRDQTKFPLSLGLYGLGLLRTESAADYSWTVVMAGNMLMTIPVIIVFFVFQRYFVQGMTMTGMKG